MKKNIAIILLVISNAVFIVFAKSQQTEVARLAEELEVQREQLIEQQLFAKEAARLSREMAQEAEARAQQLTAEIIALQSASK